MLKHISAAFLMLGQIHASFYGEHAQGWFWYHDPIIEETLKPEKAAPEAISPPQITAATRALEAYKKDLADKKNLALMHPSVSTVSNYMVAQKEMMARAERFSAIWQKVVLTTPELNYERIYPTAQYASHAQADEQHRQMESRIKDLSQTHGLFYFFKRTCTHCKVFAPIVKAFSQKYGWDVMDISLDGGANAQFATALDIKAVPALVAFDATTQKTIPIAYASVSLDQLEENLMMLITDSSGKV